MDRLLTQYSDGLISEAEYLVTVNNLIVDRMNSIAIDAAKVLSLHKQLKIRKDISPA